MERDQMAYTTNQLIVYWVARAFGTLVALAVLVWFADPVAASYPVLKGLALAVLVWLALLRKLFESIAARIVLLNALLICGGLRLGVDDELKAIERLQAAAQRSDGSCHPIHDHLARRICHLVRRYARVRRYPNGGLLLFCARAVAA